jgi:hypothetical protein
MFVLCVLYSKDKRAKCRTFMPKDDVCMKYRKRERRRCGDRTAGWTTEES